MKLSVNGRDHAIAADPATPLHLVLRDEFGLTGTKFGCGIAACGCAQLDGVRQALSAALANALYPATGKRHRSLPLALQIA